MDLVLVDYDLTVVGEEILSIVKKTGFHVVPVAR